MSKAPTPVVPADAPAVDTSVADTPAADTPSAEMPAPPVTQPEPEDFVLNVKGGSDHRNYEPACWTIKPVRTNDAGDEIITALNSATGSEFEGTVAQFNALLKD